MVNVVRQLLAVALVFSALTVSACADEATNSAREKLELIAGDGNIVQGAYRAGLSLTIAEGWHTYWRHPGDSGIAPQFDWAGSRNLGHVEVLWPAPERFEAPDDVTYGYATRVIWPLNVVPADPALPVDLKLKMSYGVCSEICIPAEAELGLTLPAYEQNDAVNAINAFVARVPAALKNPNDVTVNLSDDVLHVVLKLPAGDPVVIVEGPKLVWFGASRAKRTDNVVTYEVPYENNSGVPLEGADIRLTFVGPDTALEVTRKLK